MTQTLKNILTGAKNKEFAVQTGIRTHSELQRVVVDDNVVQGDLKLVEIIKKRPDLKIFFVSNAKTEVPIAGYINGHFVSRRIDRFLKNDLTKNIGFIDYKTDTDKMQFAEQYKRQLNEYRELLLSAYPGYKINGYILWLSDWKLEQMV